MKKLKDLIHEQSGNKTVKGIKFMIPAAAFLLSIILFAGCTKSELKDPETGKETDKVAPSVLSVTPLNNTSAVSVSSGVTITFSEAMLEGTINSESFTVTAGTTTVPGIVTYQGNTATFTPGWTFTGNTVYTCTVTTTVKDLAGNTLASNYTWTFTTAALADVTPPSILSVTPAANSSAVSTSINPSISFSEAINAATVTSSSFIVKQGSTIIPGTITCSGSNVSFKPAATLTGNTVYTVTVTTGVKDASGNSLNPGYTWSFTTAAIADVTPPAAVSVTPAANSTSANTDVSPAITFNENVDPATVNSSTFTLKQGSTSLSGAITTSGSTATFNPTAALSPGTSYTVSVTTGVKDISGNPMAAVYSWSFTTAPASTAKSFSADVMPILSICNTCHTHQWTTSSNASTFYTNLVNGGYVNPTSYTSSKIYNKINGGHPSSTVTTAQKNTILTWMSEGSKNN